VDAIATGPSSIVQQIKAGKVRALAHWGDGRLASMPEVPSFKEMGVKIEFSQWAGRFVPSATPEYITNKLREAAKQAANDERVRSVINSAGSPIQIWMHLSSKFTGSKESAQMGEVVRKIGGCSNAKNSVFMLIDCDYEYLCGISTRTDGPRS
jgi:tripartite-type tricarboxylate transporter receptor subunit TctC